MTNAPFLQSYVFPVSLYEDRDGKAELKSFEGTAFFFSKSGYFMSARHVIEDAFKKATSTGYKVGLAVKEDHGEGEETVISPLEEYDLEFAPKPYDIAIGHVFHFVDTPLKLGVSPVAVGQDVATLGYPASAVTGETDALWANLRAQKGYVQRPTLPRDIHFGSHPNGFELSFLVSPGMSGCPIFMVPEGRVIGVGVASIRSEIVDSEFSEVSDDGKVFEQRIIKIEQFGFAHDIAGLLDWKPDILDGRTLLEASELPKGAIRIITL